MFNILSDEEIFIKGKDNRSDASNRLLFDLPEAYGNEELISALLARNSPLRLIINYREQTSPREGDRFGREKTITKVKNVGNGHEKRTRGSTDFC